MWVVYPLFTRKKNELLAPIHKCCMYSYMILMIAYFGMSYMSNEVHVNEILIIKCCVRNKYRKSFILSRNKKSMLV